MTPKAVLVPGPRSDFAYLGRTQTGKLFRKQILKKGTWAHPNIPGKTWDVDDELLDKVVTNFQAGVCDIVQAPICDEANEHTEKATENLGEVIGVEKTDDGLDIILDARKHADDVGKTLIGASAMLAFNYTDTRTGEKVGPTLLHAAITNRPYMVGLSGFEEIIAASADLDREDVVVLRAPEDKPRDKSTGRAPTEGRMDREEALAFLKENGVDISDLVTSEVKTFIASLTEDDEDTHEVTSLEEADDSGGNAITSEEEDVTESTELEAAVMSALTKSGVVKLAAGKDSISAEEVGRAVVELAAKNTDLTTTVQRLDEDNTAMKLAAATREVDDLVRDGRILPKQRDRMIKLSMTDRETFDDLLPEQSIVSLSEAGVTTHDVTIAEDTQAEIARLSAKANGSGKKEN
jgi:hypothetical protein